MSDFTSRKIARKVKRLTSMLYRDYNIECSDEPTKIMFIGNAGLTTGLQQECIALYCLKFGIIEDIVMIPDKSYCFVVFQDTETCRNALNSLLGKKVAEYPEILYLSFAKSVPTIEKQDWHSGPSGSLVLKEFVSTEEEEKLLKCIDWYKDDAGQSLKHRRVLHFGYEFQYHNNNINKNEPLKYKIPEDCNILFDRLKELGYISTHPDQLTVNQYLPGQGIPSHIDTHSACEETILSLSLGSSVVMDFKHSNGRSIHLLLPQRSMLIMSGESRYAWSHGITPRKTDIIPCPGGGITIHGRGIRTSFTFRWTRSGDCSCKYPDMCDSQREKQNYKDESDENAARLEKIHVQEVYEDIAEHFSETRHKPWPNVLEFVQSFPRGSVLLDVGCGNGKYFGFNKQIYEIGCDSSKGLSSVCKERGYQVFTCNCLAIPLKDNSVDACISIAVIHHLANQNRRLKALQEIIRVLQRGGMALIYVWAKNQEYNEKKSSYLKQNRKTKLKEYGTPSNVTQTLQQNSEDSTSHFRTDEESIQPFSLPLHTNRTQFLHKDLLVPWKLKPQSQKVQTGEVRTFYRYYHVFEKGELEEVCLALEHIEIVKSFYDQGNWCIILKKK